jgi:hypothetical protein
LVVLVGLAIAAAFAVAEVNWRNGDGQGQNKTGGQDDPTHWQIGEIACRTGFVPKYVHYEGAQGDMSYIDSVYGIFGTEYDGEQVEHAECTLDSPPAGELWHQFTRVTESNGAARSLRVQSEVTLEAVGAAGPIAGNDWTWKPYVEVSQQQTILDVYNPSSQDWDEDVSFTQEWGDWRDEGETGYTPYRLGYYATKAN